MPAKITHNATETNHTPVGLCDCSCPGQNLTIKASNGNFNYKPFINQ
jgi:hypothetical protein